MYSVIKMLLREVSYKIEDLKSTFSVQLRVTTLHATFGSAFETEAGKRTAIQSTNCSAVSECTAIFMQ